MCSHLMLYVCLVIEILLDILPIDEYALSKMSCMM